MTIEYRTGNLFTYEGSLAHGVNAAGAMGKGIATEFKKKYPTMYEEYRRKCKKGTFLIGSVYAYQHFAIKNLKGTGPLTVTLSAGGTDGPKMQVVGKSWDYTPTWIYNLCIKAHWRLPAEETAIWATLRAMTKHMEENKIHEVALPRIGAGLGQLDWETVVKPIIEEVAGETNKTLIVYSL